MTDDDPRAPKAGQYALVMLIGVLALVVDQATKAGAIIVLSNPPRTVPVTSFFNLSLGFNRGVSFGFLSNLGSSGPTVLSFLTTAIIVFLFVWLWRSSRLLEQVGIALIIGGACGNLLDRIRNGAVTDFLDFYIGPYHWPTFNFADVSITLGVFNEAVAVMLAATGVWATDTAWLGWLDYVLFPMLFASMGLVAHALYLRAGEPGPNPGGLIVVIAMVLSALLF